MASLMGCLLRTVLLAIARATVVSLLHCGIYQRPGAPGVCGPRQLQTAVQLDIFGLGPAEVVVIAGAAALLYGPGRIKEQLRDKGIKGGVVSKGFKAEREERIALMIESADLARKQRAWDRIREALNSDDEELTKRMEEFENKQTQEKEEEEE
jgi:Sec-independent protein translocase protein TatA